MATAEGGWDASEPEPAVAAARLLGLPAGARPQRQQCPVVVFFGVENDARSRLAAALLAYRAHGRMEAVSMSRVLVEPSPVVVAVMAELGIDLRARASRLARDELLAVAGVLVVMGLGSLSLPPGATVFDDWCIDDPTGKDAAAVRYIRDALDRRVGRLLQRLGVPTR
jgi:arsenate reductase (thioredoxin)